ncbi:MAG: FCD domain-containing protein [Bryobacteraceae bacterium]
MRFFPEPTGRLVRKKLADQVLDRLLTLIDQGELPPGSRMPGQRALMERFGVGRPAVREALQTLERMGLIGIQHGERARRSARRRPCPSSHACLRAPFADVFPGDARGLAGGRQAFEQFLVREAARQPKKEGIEQLRLALEAQEAARGDAVRFMTADIGFHVAIASLTNTPLYPALSEAMLGWIFGLFPRLLHAPNVEDLTLKEHAAILRAIEKRDPEAAARAMKRRLSHAHPRYHGGPAESAP